MKKDLATLITLSPEEVLIQMGSSLKGLTNHCVEKNKQLYGLNEVVLHPYHLLIFEAISHSTNPLIAILLVAALVSAFTGNIVSSAVIITMVLISIGLDYFQSHKSLLDVAMGKLTKNLKHITPAQ